jgi:uncharacterized membrane protein
VVVSIVGDGETASDARRVLARWLPLAVILCLAAGLRIWRLDHLSLWYDEVVTMRLARSGGPRELFDLLGRIDATRAPLHPLLLMAWIKPFGSGDLAARALSTALGIATVAAVYATARTAFGETTARWSAWLCGICPTLVYFSREVRMYSLLVFLTVLSWWLFLSFRTSAGWARAIAYALLLAAIVYTQPLGLFMLAAHVAAYVAVRGSLKLSTGRWISAVAMTCLLIAPWIGNYFDHPPDYPLPRYPLKYLIAVPIEYIGGNALTLIPLAALIAHGLLAWRDGRLTLREPAEAIALLCWFAVPIVAMYLYSQVGHPIFGPSRYNLFVAPAYLMFVARGLAAMPRPARFAAAAIMLLLTIQNLASVTYAPGVKADWRGLARWILASDGQPATVVVVPHDPLFPRTQYEAARYYLEPDVAVELDLGESAAHEPDPASVVYRVHCFVDEPNEPGEAVVARFYGLTAARPAPHE